MLIKRYNKLIRDKIDEVIIAHGHVPTTRILTEKEFQGALRTKVLEEALELRDAHTRDEVVEEIIDLQELIDAIAQNYSLSRRQLRTLQNKKAKARGGFKRRLFLVRTGQK